MNILITGVAGLLGSRLADWMLKTSDAKIIGIDDMSGGYAENVDPRVDLHKINLASSDELEKIFEKNKPQYVFHFAAYAAEGLSPFIRQFNYENNLIATTRLINQSIKHDVKRIVFTSTMAVYGVNKPPFIESYQQAPIDPYGIAKYACEMDLKVAGEQHKLDWCIFRPHNVYGVNQNIWDKYRNVLGIWMYQHMNGIPLSIYGDGMQTRAFSYVDDCVPYFWKGATDPQGSKQIFNIGSDDHCSINEACDTLIEVMGGGKKVYLEQRHEVKDAWVSHEKIKNLLNFKNSTDLKTGLTKMWKWANSQPKRERKLWSSYELDKGIYDFWKLK